MNAGVANRRMFVSGQLVEYWEHPEVAFGWSREDLRDYAARGDWVLHLDTDERVGGRLKDRLPELCTSRWHDFYRIPMYWILGSRRGCCRSLLWDGRNLRVISKSSIRRRC